MKNNCRLCGAPASQTHTSKVLGKYEAAYFLCPDCDLLQTEPPYWLDEAYRDSISTIDTGLMHRNQTVSKRVAVFCFRHGLDALRCADFAGGYGILVRMLRDLGLDFFWSDKYSPNLAARGFDAAPENRYDIVTAFEALEHFDDPGRQLAEILENWAPRFLLFETTLREEKQVPPPGWKYYAPESGQHVAFYSPRTLAFVAAKFSYHFWKEGRLLVLSKQPRPRTLASWIRWPRALIRAYAPDSIPFINRDREAMEKSLQELSAANSSA